MSAWSDPRTDLRNLLSDGELDHYKYRKRCLGFINGINTVFKTFEFRRTTNLVSAVAPLGVYVDGVHVSVGADSTEVGEFVLSSAPLDGSVVEASYYYQWFKNSELDIFLKNAMQWLNRGNDVTALESGLQPAALHYAAQEAYQKLTLRWAERMSDAYLLEDAPTEEAKKAIETYKGLAEFMMEKSVALRDDFYKRSGQTNAPSWGVARGNVRDVVPRR